MVKGYCFVFLFWLKCNKEIEIYNYYDLGMLIKCICVVFLKELIYMWEFEWFLDKFIFFYCIYVFEESYLVVREWINILFGVNWFFICGIFVDSGV